MHAPSFLVRAAGPLATLQDLGRPGMIAMGVGVSGAADRASFTLGNRLVGNSENDTGIEATLGGLTVEAVADLTVAVTGAPCDSRRNGVRVGHNCVIHLTKGDVLALGIPTAGLRTYLAVRGGIRAEKVLGSSATDILSGLGPRPLAAGDLLTAGPHTHDLPDVDFAPVAEMDPDTVPLLLHLGPRHEWFQDEALALLFSASWDVTADSNRVGMRLAGPTLKRSRTEELPSEGMANGAVQVPASGQPILFLPDHPVTGGYPVIGVVDSGDMDRAAQIRPGQRIRFVRARLPSTGNRP
ncbi:biotin-dependent carboxyltransferase family protein [Rhodococcus sp. NPDC003318]|uniref:5-oxoprolinase subunit C family protein n=1 Tax=Rhodococcus sp. NPDC003318 TaxID=3364503 RepID=UPI0036969137